MIFNRYNNPSKKRANAKRKQTRLEALPFVVVVMTRDSWEMVDKKRFKTYEAAMNYASNFSNEFYVDVRF